MSTSSPIREILVLHHSHTDIGYTHPPTVVWELHRRFIDEAIELCEATANWPEPSRVRWTCETTAPLLYWLERASSRQIARFRHLVKRGQIGAGAMHLNITPLSSFETLVRGLAPIEVLRRELGLPLKVAINHDVNGLPWPITDLLLDVGVEMLLMGINVHFGGFPMVRPRGFSWLSPSDRPLLAFNAEHYQSFDREARLAENNLDAMEKGLANYLARLEASGYPYDFAYLSATHPTFPDNNPPNPRTAELIRQWNESDRAPLIRFVLPEELAARLAEQSAKPFPRHSGDWTDFWNFGAGSSAVETKLSRHARQRLSAAETLHALAPLQGKMPATTWNEAWRNVLHFEEHTWCSYAALRTAPPEPVNEVWYQKAITAYQASSLSSLLLRDGLDELAGPGNFGDTARGILLYNPSGVEQTRCVRVPTRITKGEWQFFSSNVHQLEVHRHLNTPPDHGTQNPFSEAAPTIVAGPFTLPPFGYRFVSMQELLKKSMSSGKTCAVTRRSIESPHFRLSFAPQTGRILSLYDKALKRELIDADSTWNFFGFVQETVDSVRHAVDSPDQGREAFFDTNWPRLLRGESCWKPDWVPQRRQPSRLLDLRTETTVEGVSLLLRWEAPGVDDFSQRITLDAATPRVICSASFNKTDVRSAEGIYFAFPLALETWRAHFDSAGTPVEFEREQLTGSCRDWITVDSYVALHDAHGAVTLACPDAPLVQVGNFRFARGNQDADRGIRPLVLGWAMNNYWNTNFRASQPGYAQFRYELTSQKAFDPLQSARAGLAAASQIEWQPFSATPPSTAKSKTVQLAEVEGDGVILLGATLTEKRAVVLRISNVRNVITEARVRFGEREIRSAKIVDATGRKVRAARVDASELGIDLPARTTLLVSATVWDRQPGRPAARSRKS